MLLLKGPRITRRFTKKLFFQTTKAFFFIIDANFPLNVKSFVYLSGNPISNCPLIQLIDLSMIKFILYKQKRDLLKLKNWHSQNVQIQKNWESEFGLLYWILYLDFPKHFFDGVDSVPYGLACNQSYCFSMGSIELLWHC